MTSRTDPGPVPATQAIQVAVVAALSATTMLFASLSSALLVRRSFEDWRPASAPWPLALLALGALTSVAIEWVIRATSQRGLPKGAFALSSLAYLTAACGAIMATAANEGLAAPHNAFVALLLSLHVLHALAGSIFALWILSDGPSAPSANGRSSLARLVVHFLTALLAAIMMLLFVAS